MTEFISQFGIELFALLLGALAGLTLLDDLLADFASRVPLVGPVLAPIMRRLSGRFRSWLSERIPQAADRIVLQVEHELAGAPGPAKLDAAAERLRRAEPGMTVAESVAAVQAAVDRAKAAPYLGDALPGRTVPAVTPPDVPARDPLGEVDRARMERLFETLAREVDEMIERAEREEAERGKATSPVDDRRPSPQTE